MTGPANCRKTFLLKPLKPIFWDSIFENLDNDKYAWVGADRASLLLSNDFRWSKEMIKSHDLLLLLENKIVKLPAPKNINREDKYYHWHCYFCNK